MNEDVVGSMTFEASPPPESHGERMTSTPAVNMPAPAGPFDYAGVPADTADAPRAQASRIRSLVKNTTEIIIQVGKDLIAVKQAIDHGKFQSWIEAECGFSVRTAENYIRAAEFAEGKNATVALLQPATVYRLAAKSTPPAIVDDVLRRVGKVESFPMEMLRRLLSP